MERNDTALSYDTAHLVLLLDLEGYIISASKPMAAALGIKETALQQINFNIFLNAGQMEEWDSIIAEVKKNVAYHNDILLHLNTHSGNIIPVFLQVIRVSPLPLVLLSSATSIPQGVMHDTCIQPIKKGDDVLAQEIHDYVMENLENPLPSLHKLSAEFDTNEFRLKDVFRKKFKTSIFQFYNDERLKRSLKLLRNTDYSLKTIALMSGFNDYSNFSKAFRKKFGYKPADVNRNPL